MARPIKTGLDYFPFDTGFFDDEKIACLAGEFGLKGELVAVKLLCAVYRNGYFLEWSEATKLKFLRSVPGVSVGLLDQIISSLLRWGFFCRSLVESANVLTSVGIQRRYFEATKKRRWEENLPYLLIDLPKNYSLNGVSDSEIGVSDSEMGVSECDNPQIKRNNKKFASKPKSPPTTHAEDKARFSQFCRYYLSPEREEFRNIHKKKYGIDDLKTAFEEFYELCVERDVLPEILTVKDFEQKFRYLYCIPLNEKRFSMPQGTVPERKQRFKEEVTRLLDATKDSYGQYVYTPEMCSNFFRYWTELSRDGTLMRFEEQNFWETSKRLKSWKERMP